MTKEEAEEELSSLLDGCPIEEFVMFAPPVKLGPLVSMAEALASGGQYPVPVLMTAMLAEWLVERGVTVTPGSVR